MANFRKGDTVVLASKNNGTKAFLVLRPNTAYIVEGIGSQCSACANGRAGRSTTIKIAGPGLYLCEEAFVLYNPAVSAKQPVAAVVPAPVPPAANQPAGVGGASVAAARSGTPAKRDPARDLYNNDVDWFDLLPDATPEEMATLPTYEELSKRDRERMGVTQKEK